VMKEEKKEITQGRSKLSERFLIRKESGSGGISLYLGCLEIARQGQEKGACGTVNMLDGSARLGG